MSFWHVLKSELRAKRKTFRAISLLWLGSTLGAGCAFLTQVILARKLGPDLFGIFVASLNTVNLLSPLAGFGIGQFWLKAFGQEGWQAMRWLPGSFKFISLSTAMVLILLICWASLGPHDENAGIILMILTCHVLGQCSIDLVSSKLQLEERYLKLVLWQSFPHMSRLFIVTFLAYIAPNLLSAQTVAFSYAAVAFALFVTALGVLLRLRQGTFELKGHVSPEAPGAQRVADAPGMLQVALQSWPFGVAGLFYLIYYQSDIILLKYMKSAEIAGLYNVAFTILAAVYMLPSVIYQKFLLPKIHRWAHHDRRKFFQIYRQGNVTMLILGLLTMLAIWLLAPWGINFLFGQKYQQAVGLLMTLAVSVPILFVANSVGATLVTKSHMKSKVKCMGAVAGINIILNILLIPHYGAYGAAASTIISNASLLLIYFIYAERIVFSDLT